MPFEYEKSAPRTCIFEKPAFTAKSVAVMVTVPAPEKRVGNALPQLILIAFARGCPEQKKKNLFQQY